MSWKKSMAPSGKSLLARRLGLAAPSPGGGRRRGSGPPSWGLRAWEGAQCASQRHTQPVGCAWAPASPFRGRGGSRTQPRFIPAGGRLPTGGRAPLLGGQPWASAGRGSPSSQSPRFRPRPGGRRGRGDAAPSAQELPPLDRALAHRTHRPRDPGAPVRWSLRHTIRTPRARCWEGSASPALRSRWEWATLDTCGRPVTGTFPAIATLAGWEGEESQRRLFPLPGSHL